MGIAVDQTATGINPNGVTSATLTWGTNPTAGTKVLVFATSFVSVSSVVDNGSTPTTFTLDASDNDNGGNDYFVQVWRADNIKLPSSGSYHVTLTFAATATGVVGGRSYTGMAAGGPSSTSLQPGGASTGTSVATGTLTPPAAGALLIGGFLTDSGANPESITLTTSGAAAIVTETNGTILAGAGADHITTTGTAQGLAWTLGSSADWATVLACYAAAPSGTSVSLTAPGVALAAPLVTPSAGATVALTAPNAALAAPVPVLGAGATVALTAPNAALAAPLVTPVVGKTVALTTPGVALAAPLVTRSADASVALTAPNVTLAAPVVASGGSAKAVALTTPNLSLAAPVPSLSAGGKVALTAPGIALAAPAVAPASVVPPSFPAPAAQLGIRLELSAAGTWVNVTSDLDHGPMTIGRGHPDESTTVSPSTFGTQLTNKAARYSPDNVMSDLWPWCVQNMPGRVSIPAARHYLRLEADNSDCAVAADSAALHVTGSLEVRIALRLSDWQGCFLAGRIDSTTTSAWGLLLRSDGTMRFFWWDSSGTEWQVVSDAPLPYISGDFAVRVLLDATVGTVAFYTAPSIDGTYTQLGDAFAVTGGAATSVRAGSDPLRVGWSPAGFSDIGSGAAVQMNGRVYEVRLYSGIGGLVKADGIFSAQTAGTTTWTDSAGNAWSTAGGAEISDRNYRSHFESSEWPQDEPEYNPDAGNDTTVATDALVPLVGGGLLRRLSQRAPNVSSPMYRAILAQTGTLAPVAYWPMEDSSAATQFGAAAGPNPMTWNGGPPSPAASSAFACSAPLPTLGGAALQGLVAPYTTGGGSAWTVRFLADVPTLPGSNQVLFQVNCTGGLAAYVIFVAGPATVALTAFDASLNVIADTGPVAWTGGIQQPLWWSIEAQPSGGHVQYSLVSLAPGSSVGLSANVTSSATGSAGNVSLVAPAPFGGIWTDTVIGHVQVQATWVSLFSLAGALVAHLGEPAAVRFARLCAENGIPCRIRGNAADTVPMGVQQISTLTTLLQACADADQGEWTELRQVLGWGYVTRKALYNQPATAAVSYLSDHLSMWSTAPTRDDQVAVNDVTYTNDSGSTVRMFAAPGQPIPGGRMSTAAPAAGGIGSYAQTYSVSVASDAQLPDLAGWRLHVGTVDQARLPGILIDLARSDAADIYDDVLDLDLGDRLVISDPPRRLGFEPVTQLAQALTETLWYDTLTIGMAGVPELPYQVVKLDAGMHLAPPAAVLSAAVNATATSWSVAADSGSTALFSTSAGDYPQDWVIDGERVTVTAVSGSSSPQPATVIRSVNGVVKSHSAGAAVGTWPPPAIGL